MRKLKTLAAIGLLIGLAACNTVKGAGQDIETGGAKLSDQATETQHSM
jgi:predicted small secreted protein